MSAYLEQGLLKRNPFETIDQAGVGELVARRRRAGPGDQAGRQARRLRRARRRPGVDRLLLPGRARLRVLLAVPGADRPAGGGPGGDRPRLTSDRRCDRQWRLRSGRGHSRRGHRQGPGRDRLRGAGRRAPGAAPGRHALGRACARSTARRPRRSRSTPSWASTTASAAGPRATSSPSSGRWSTSTSSRRSRGWPPGPGSPCATTTRPPAATTSAGPASTRRSSRPSPGTTNGCSPARTPPRPGATCGASAATTEKWCGTTGWAGRPEGWDHLVRALGRAAGRSGRRRAGHRRRVRALHRLLPRPAPVPHLRPGRPAGRARRPAPPRQVAGPSTRTPPATAVYDKSRVLYGLNWAKKAVVDAGRVVVCEGYTDVIGLQRAGVGEAVATCGTVAGRRPHPAAHQLRPADRARLRRRRRRSGGGRAVLRVGAPLRGRHPGGGPAGGRRPGRPGPARTPRPWLRAVDDARPYLAFRLDRLFGRADLSTPEGRARAAAEADGVVREHPNELVRDQYLMQVADRCRVEPDRLRQLAAEQRCGGDPGRGGARPRPAAVPGPDGAAGPAPTCRALGAGRRRQRSRVRGAAPGRPPTRRRSPTGWSRFFRPSAGAGRFDALLSADHACTTPSRRPIPRPADLLQRLAVEDSRRRRRRRHDPPGGAGRAAGPAGAASRDAPGRARRPGRLSRRPLRG